MPLQYLNAGTTIHYNLAVTQQLHHILCNRKPLQLLLQCIHVEVDQPLDGCCLAGGQKLELICWFSCFVLQDPSKCGLWRTKEYVNFLVLQKFLAHLLPTGSATSCRHILWG